jgi:hypothetical protein
MMQFLITGLQQQEYMILSRQNGIQIAALIRSRTNLSQTKVIKSQNDVDVVVL